MEELAILHPERAQWRSFPRQRSNLLSTRHNNRHDKDARSSRAAVRLRCAVRGRRWRGVAVTVGYALVALELRRNGGRAGIVQGQRQHRAGGRARTTIINVPLRGPGYRARPSSLAFSCSEQAE